MNTQENINNEEWRPVEGYEGLYEVSNLGRVWSIERIDSGGVRRGGHFMSFTSNKGGYLRCKLTKNGKFKLMLVHKLVATAFIPNPNNYPCINHKDEDQTNNCVYVNPDGTIDFDKSNLEWCTYSYNINYGNRKAKVKEKALNGPLSKSVAKYSVNGDFIQVFPSVNEASRQTGIKLSNISNCCNKKPHYLTAGGYVWRWADLG